MSLRNFKSVQKIQNVMMIYFTQPTASAAWDDTMSITIPAAEAQKLLEHLQAALHPKSARK